MVSSPAYNGRKAGRRTGGYSQLTDKRSNGSGNLDTEVLVGIQSAVVTIDVSYHGSADGDSEDIVGICVEANTGYQASPNMIPTTRMESYYYSVDAYMAVKRRKDARERGIVDVFERCLTTLVDG